MTNEQWQKVSDYTRESLLRIADPSLPQTSVFPEALSVKHRGFFLGLISPKGDDIAREGFLFDDTNDLRGSVDRAIIAFAAALESQKIAMNAIQAGTLQLCLICEIVFIKEPLNWDDSKDGVYFSWGDRYKGLYLPYQIRRSDSTKIEIMEKLCSYQAHVPSNLWQYPCGMVYKLVAESYP